MTPQHAIVITVALLSVSRSLSFVLNSPATHTFGLENVYRKEFIPRPKRAFISSSSTSLSETSSPALLTGVVLAPEGDPRITFDSKGVANPVVLPPSDATSKWRMFYYGHAGTWQNNTKPFLPTGSIGLAESDDGIHWTKIPGKEEGGAVLAPSSNLEDWDGLHIGVGDVIPVGFTPEGQEELHMYYLGGSNESMDVPQGLSPTGMRMRIGKAKSTDGGRTWERMGMVFDFDAEEGFFASWPRVVKPSSSEKPWQLIYHVFNGAKFRVFGATSVDEGETWQRRGELLRGEDDDEASFDWLGIGTRSVTRWRDGMLMIFEGVDSTPWTGGGPVHRFGLAYNPDSDGAGEWTKDMETLGVSKTERNENGSILAPGVEPMSSWTKLVVGTPYLLSLPDGSLRLYHCGRESQEDQMFIGLLVSHSGDVGTNSWKAAKQ